MLKEKGMYQDSEELLGPNVGKNRSLESYLKFEAIISLGIFSNSG